MAGSEVVCFIDGVQFGDIFCGKVDNLEVGWWSTFVNMTGNGIRNQGNTHKGYARW